MAKLTYEEVVQTCCLLGVLVERLLENLRATGITLEFLTTEVLKIKSEIYTTKKKTPWKRIDELEKMIKGMNAYYQEKLSEIQHRQPLKKDTNYVYSSINKGEGKGGK